MGRFVALSDAIYSHSFSIEKTKGIILTDRPFRMKERASLPVKTPEVNSGPGSRGGGMTVCEDPTGIKTYQKV